MAKNRQKSRKNKNFVKPSKMAKTVKNVQKDKNVEKLLKKQSKMIKKS